MKKMRAWLASACLAAAMIGCGDPEPTPVDGGEGDASRVDGSMPDGGGDPCEGLTLCTTAGISCEGDSLVTCEENADGCLVETTEDCAAGGEVCDDTSGTAACVDPCTLLPAADRCDTAGRTCTDAGTLEICAANADGCLVREVTECDAMPGGVCDDSGTMPMCVLPPDPCAGIADACATAGTTCSGESLVTCAPNAFGCLVETTTDCTSRAGGLCDETAATPACVFTGDPCEGITECTTPTEPTCDGPSLATCAPDAFGCMVATWTDCSAEMFGFCDETATGPDACSTAATDPCMGVTECGTTESRTCADRDTLSICTANAFGCFVTDTYLCTDDGEVCDDTSGTATCVDPCSLVDVCPSATYCDGTDIVTCAADTNGCLVEDSRSACTTGLTCGVPAGGTAECVADAMCPEAGTTVIDCASGTVTGDTATGSAIRTAYGPCTTSTSYAGREEIFVFRNAEAARVTIESTRTGTSTGDFDLFAIDAGDGTATCGSSTLLCDDASRLGGGDEEITFDTTAGDTKYIVYDRFNSTTDTTTFELAITCVVPVCGDGTREAFEACDDGDTTAGDGCSDTCTVETGSVCYGSPSICGPALTCGNGVRETGETCDDANTTAGDGCSATCAVETGYSCTTATPNVCTLLCGNGTVNTGETCDDGNATAGDGCSAACLIETNYNCYGTPSTCVVRASNADCATPRTITATTTFTAENLRAGGASSRTSCGGGSGTTALYYDVTIPPNTSVTIDATPTGTSTWDIVFAEIASCAATSCGTVTDDEGSGTAETRTIDNTGTTPMTVTLLVRSWSSSYSTFDIAFTYTPIVCGNGAIQGAEACDDGNTTAGDGCSATCAIETGYVCTGAPSTCLPLAANAACTTATTITFPQTITGENLVVGGPRPTATSCGPTTAANALFYSITIPAGQLAQVVVTRTGTTTWDPVILQLTDCSAASCTSVVDTSGATETMTIANTGTTALSRIIAVRNDGTAMGTYDIAFTSGPLPFSTIAAACADMTAGTAVTTSSADDGTSTRAALPFSFSLQGSTATHYVISTNGTVQLLTSDAGTGTAAASNSAIPNTSTPNLFVAPFWDDLVAPSSSTSIRVHTIGTAPNRTFVVEWNGMSTFGTSGSVLTFQAHLVESGAVEMHYCSMVGTGTRATGDSATIGLENAGGTAGIGISYNTAGAATTGTGYRITAP